jgi:hypothetical protein
MLCPPAEFEVEHPIFTLNYTYKTRLRGFGGIKGVSNPDLV